MNDLERDLKELFDTKARGVDTTPAASGAVLRRGRRRQVGVAVGGALAGIAVLAVASVVTLSMLDGKTDLQPAVPDGPYGERTAVIEGFEVQAPAGWTLIDYWGLASTMATQSETCTFDAVGTEVGGDGQATDGVTLSPADTVCTSDPGTRSVGVPVLQLSTFDPGLTSPVCDVFGAGTGGTLPSDGVAVLVTAFIGTLEVDQVRSALTGACAATPDIASIVQGPTLTFVTATFSGERADPALLDAASNVTDLGRHDTRAPRPSSLSGPAYVVASFEWGSRWQLETGVSVDEATGVSGTALFVLDPANPSSMTILAPALGHLQAYGSHGGEQDSLFVGTASNAVDRILVGDGEATLIPWPSSLQAFEPAVGLAGASIWWAQAPDGTDIQLQLADGTQEPGHLGAARTPGATPSMMPGVTVAEGLTEVGAEPWRVTADLCDDSPCLRIWDGGTMDNWNGWADRYPPKDEPSVTVNYDTMGTLVMGTVPAQVTRVEIASSDDTGAVVDSCTRVAASGFEDVCVLAVMLPAAADLNDYDLTIRFMDADGNELFPALVRL